MTPPINQKPNVNSTGVPGLKERLESINENTIVDSSTFKDGSIFTSVLW